MDDLKIIHDSIKALLEVTCSKEKENITRKIESLEGLLQQLEILRFDNNIIRNLKDELSLLRKHLDINRKTDSLLNPKRIKDLN